MQATCDDIQSIANIEIESHFSDNRPLNSLLNDLFLHEYKKRWKKKLQDGMPTYLISASEKRIGFINYSYHNQIAEIHNIYILPEYRRQQMGRHLCLHTLEKMRQSSIASVTLWLVDGRRLIRKFYEALGFQSTSTTRKDKITEDFTLTERQYVLALQKTPVYCNQDIG